MSTCPVCQHQSPPEAKVCPRCGNVFRRDARSASGGRPLLLVAALVAAFAIPLLFWAIRREATLELRYFGTRIREAGPDFRGQEVPMKRIDARVVGGFLEVPLSSIEAGKLVQFYYLTHPVMQVPLIAYIGPTGRLITAFAWCDPCESAGYHFESNTLVCNKCKTTWALEGDGPTPRSRPAHMGFAGNCREYGPEFVEHSIVDGMVRISEATLLAWRPRQAPSHS